MVEFDGQEALRVELSADDIRFLFAGDEAPYARGEQPYDVHTALYNATPMERAAIAKAELHRIMASGDLSERLVLAVFVERLAKEEVEATDARVQKAKQEHAHVKAVHDAWKEALAQYMTENTVKRIEMEPVTVSLVRGRERVIIEDEDALPDAYWRVKREPDKAKIKAAVQADGIFPPGAMIERGPSTVRITLKDR